MADEIRRPLKTAQLKCGKRTFFFDVNLASNNKKYLKITESSIIGEGDQAQKRRNSFLLFPEDLVAFQDRLGEMTQDLK